MSVRDIEDTEWRGDTPRATCRSEPLAVISSAARNLQFARGRLRDKPAGQLQIPRYARDDTSTVTRSTATAIVPNSGQRRLNPSTSCVAVAPSVPLSVNDIRISFSTVTSVRFCFERSSSP